ncbi:MAG: hypothetical protein ACXV3D_06270, partial [Halobacteriota archaeon]
KWRKKPWSTAIQDILKELQAYKAAVYANIYKIDPSLLSEHDHTVVETEWMRLAKITQDGAPCLEELNTWSAGDDHGLDV